MKASERVGSATSKGNIMPLVKTELSLTLGAIVLAASSLVAQGTTDTGQGSTPPGPTRQVVVSIMPNSEISVTNPPGWKTLPDEHTSMVRSQPDPFTFHVFAAGDAGPGMGAVVLDTTDFVTFLPALDYTSPVLQPPNGESKTDCSDPSTVNAYDQGYAAPGSVFPDRAGKPGTLLMLYEAENHCRESQLAPGTYEYVSEFYVSVGVAKSIDDGMTWPESERYAGVTSPLPKPAASVKMPPVNPPIGTAIPSGLISGGYVYAYYTNYPGHDIEVARAADVESQLSFTKFTGSDWSAPGLAGTGVSLITPPAGYQCGQVGVNEVDGANDEQGPLFLMTMECDNNVTGAWYYSTSRDLESQLWTAPVPISGSERPITNTDPQGATCAENRTNGFDGWYPSFVSPTALPGHVSMNGYVLYFNGCLTGVRQFGVRQFSISVQPSQGW